MSDPPGCGEGVRYGCASVSHISASLGALIRREVGTLTPPPTSIRPGAPTSPRQVARRRTSHTVTPMSSTDNASSQPPSIHWNGQNRLAGWELVHSA
jgi:hypothetical protein